MQEIELKLSLPTAHPESLSGVLSTIPILASAEKTSGKQHLALHNIYFDTPDHRLHSQRIALRLRQKGDLVRPEWLQTLKIGANTDSALSQRGEWESAVEGSHLSAALLAQTPWAELDPDGVLFAALVPCFTTVFDRTVWQVSLDDKSRIEVALDVGQVVSAAKTQPIAELELELLSGQPAALFDVAQQIAGIVAVLPATSSKAQRGFALAQSTQQVALTRLKYEHLQPATVRKTLRQAFGRALVDFNALLLSDAPDLIRQARVSWRRFRALVRYSRVVWPLPTPTDFSGFEAMALLQNPLFGVELLKISRWLELDFEQ